MPNVKKQKLTKLQQYFIEKENMELYKPDCLIKSISKDKFTVGLWFWIWDIKNKEKVIHELNTKILQAIKEKKIELG